MTRDHSAQTTFDGFASPNFTQVPDELFDVLMPQLSDAELRVLLYIVRRTFGFKRDADAISLSQMVSGITTREGQ
nr:replication protein [Chloroflexota bacterium]